MNEETNTAPRKLQLPGLKRIFTMSAHLPFGDFMTLWEHAGKPHVVDTRLRREGQHCGFAHERDIEALMKRVDVPYEHMISLAPTRQLRDALSEVMKAKGASTDVKMRRSRAWEAFLIGYIQVVFRERQALVEGAPLRRALETCGESIVFLCACAHHKDCHRQATAGVIGQLIEGVEVTHLDARTIGGKEPNRKNPLRVLLNDIPAAGLVAESTRR